MNNVISCCLLLLSFAPMVSAQIVDFEDYPPGVTGPPWTEGLPIGSQYEDAPYNVKFSLLDNNFNAMDDLPLLAEVGGAGPFAFSGFSAGTFCNNAATPNDMPDTSDVGCKFLTDDGVLGPGLPPMLFIEYLAGVQIAKGVILDVDGKEGWLIRAYATNIVDAQTPWIAYDFLCSDGALGVFNPPDPSLVCNTIEVETTPLNGGGAATPWEIDVSGSGHTIQSLLISYVGTTGAPGLAFDNFEPGIPVLPDPTGNNCDSICCQGACCTSDGECILAKGEDCQALQATFHGVGSSCEPLGACNVGDLCVRMQRQACMTLEGNFLGEATSCAK